jgi:hypothetical protein
MIVTSPAVIRTYAAADQTGKGCRLAFGALGHTPVATGVNGRARTGSPVPIGAEPFRQGREHGHGRFWPLLQYGV